MSWLEWTVEYHGFISAVAAVMSAIVACVLLCLGILQHRWNKQHNKALVKPYLTGMLLGEPSSSISFSIVNKGLGTALIDELKITFNGDHLTVREFSELLMQVLPSFVVAVGEFNNQYALSPNDSFNLVRVTRKSTIKSGPEQIKKELEYVSRSVVFQVDYHSLLDPKIESYISKNDLSLLNAQ